MSEELDLYRDLEKKLVEIRRANRGADSSEEDEILIEMDYTWLILSAEEQAMLSAEPPVSDISLETELLSDIPQPPSMKVCRGAQLTGTRVDLAFIVLCWLIAILVWGCVWYFSSVGLWSTFLLCVMVLAIGTGTLRLLSVIRGL